MKKNLQCLMNCVHEEALAIIGPMYALKAELVHI